MDRNNAFFYVSFRDALRDSRGLGEDWLLRIIAQFTCAPNSDVEHFLKHNAIDFTKKDQSVTYFVFPKDDIADGFSDATLPVSYFTVTTKPLIIQSSDIPSNTIRRKIERICRLDESKQNYTMSAYLVAQLGKNYRNGLNELITGDELLNAALNLSRQAQYLVGGTVVFVETEDNEKLIDFYVHNGFHLLATHSMNNNELVQMFRII